MPFQQLKSMFACVWGACSGSFCRVQKNPLGVSAHDRCKLCWTSCASRSGVVGWSEFRLGAKFGMEWRGAGAIAFVRVKFVKGEEANQASTV